MDFRKIKHMFVLMLENRSFDHMLGFANLPGADGIQGKAFVNRDPTGEPISASAEAGFAGNFDTDPGHDFEDVRLQLYGTDTPAPGQEPDMSGFVKAYAKKSGDVTKSHNIMRCFSPDKVSVLVSLAQQYAVCDRWFSSVPGPTLPNRLFAHCGTSAGRLDMSPDFFTNFVTVYEVLDKFGPHGVPATIYSQGWSSATTFTYLLKFQDQFFATLDDFFSDCAGSEEDVPAYCFLEPRYSSGLVEDTFFPQNDQHPDSDVRQGEKLIFRVYQAIRKNKKLWESSVLVITYDEHGGLADHVPPPKCLAPDDKPGDLGFDFKRLGVRVPAVIVSPYIDPGTVCHTQFDHTSLGATARKLFTGIHQDDALGKRAAQANTLDDLTIFTRDTPRQDVPNILAPQPPAPSRDPMPLSGLQRVHLQQAVFVNDKLPPDRRIKADPSRITTDQQADAYLRQVFAAAAGRANLWEGDKAFSAARQHGPVQSTVSTFDSDEAGLLIVNEEVWKETRVSQDGPRRRGSFSGSSVPKVAKLSFEDLAGYFDIVDVWLSDRVNYFQTWEFAYIHVDLSEAVKDQRLKVAFRIEYDLKVWAKPYSISDLATAFEETLAKRPTRFVYEQNNENTVIDGFGVSTRISWRDTVQNALDMQRELKELVAFVTAEVSPRDTTAVSMAFTFPSPIKNACEQYLLYFVQFLSDLGIEANAEVKERASKVLFSVTPVDQKQALGKIHEALEVYLDLWLSPEMDTMTSQFHDVAVSQLQANVFHLRSQITLAMAAIEMKNATINAKDANIALLQDRIDLRTLQPQHMVEEHDTGREELVKDVVSVRKWNYKFLEIDVPGLLRKLKRRLQ